MDKIRMRHPELGDREIQATEGQAAHYVESGWVRVDDQVPAAVQEPGEEPGNTETPPPAPTQRSRRGDKKEGDVA
jgi:hypothetical protein